MIALRLRLRTWWQSRTLGGKQSILLLVCSLLFIPLLYLALSSLLGPTFTQLENSAVAAQSARARNALVAYKQGLESGVSDYAVWDDSFAYIQKPDPAFERATLSPLAFSNMGLDIIGYVRFDGTVVFSRAVNRESLAIIDDESAHFAAVLREGAFFEAARSKEKHNAYLRTRRGIYAISSQHIVKSDESGKADGYIAMGTLLDAGTLSKALQVNVDVHLAHDAASHNDEAALISAEDLTATITSENKITTRLGLAGQDGKLLASLDFDTPREITAAGKRAIWYATAAVVAAMLTLLQILSAASRQIVVNRLRELEVFVKTMRTNDTPLPARMTYGVDEIATLARQFQAFGAELDGAEEELRQSSYLQGKADSAAGMLHNVRNALAPVRVMQEKWLAEEDLPYRINMAKALEELQDETVDAQRREQLQSYILLAAGKIAQAADVRRTEMTYTKSSIDQIAAILGSYNFDTSGSTAPDSIDFDKLLQIEINTLAARGTAPIAWSLPEAIPALLGNRVHLGQVLGNVLVNADEAMEAAAANAAEGFAKRMVVTWEALADNQIAIHFNDSGDGIEPDLIPNVFRRGYSTREHKSGGLGMHWSANVMRAMGGSITITSEGRGKGAQISLILPRQVSAEIRQAA